MGASTVDTLIDGTVADRVPLSDRGLQFGDGLFETIAIVDGRPCLWDAHLARLKDGCRRLALPPPDSLQMADEARRLCAGRERGVLKILWTAGDSRRGYRRPRPVTPRRVLQVSPWPYDQVPQYWRVRLCAHRLAESPALAGLKHMNRLDQVIARAEWDDDAIQEGLVLGQDGRVVCATAANLFVQREGQLSTPAIDSAGIRGVVRDLVVECGRRAGEPVTVGRVSPQDVLGADALYLTNSLIGIVRVSACDAVDFDPAVSEHPAIVQARERCHRGAAA